MFAGLLHMSYFQICVVNKNKKEHLFSTIQHLQVGTYLKTPKFPVWVVCSESHFSVLFSPRRDLVNDWKAERRFDLIYYDGLSRQQEEIKLTISMFLIYVFVGLSTFSSATKSPRVMTFWL